MGQLKSTKQMLKVALVVAVAKLAVALTTIFYELAINNGMNTAVLITYRFLCASVISFPMAFLERISHRKKFPSPTATTSCRRYRIRRIKNKRPVATWSLLFQGFICATLIGPLSQHMYALSLSHTSTAYVAAISNLISPFTFIVALLFRLEKLETTKMTGKLKVIGTVVGVGGAMALTFYKGPEITMIKSIQIFHGGQSLSGHTTDHKTSPFDKIIGFICALTYAIFHAFYYNLQSKLSMKYPCHYTSAFFYSWVCFIESLIYALIRTRSWEHWSLHKKIRLFSAIFQGICSALSSFLVMNAVHLQGPLFVSSFNPLVLVFVMVVGCFLLAEKLYLGSLVGSMIIIVGLYLVLWAKSKETDGNVVTNVIPSTTLEDTPVAQTSFTVDSTNEIDEILEVG